MKAKQRKSIWNMLKLLWNMTVCYVTRQIHILMRYENVNKYKIIWLLIKGGLIFDWVTYSRWHKYIRAENSLQKLAIENNLVHVEIRK